MKDYEEMVREAEAFKDTDKEIEGLIPVKARVSKEPRAVFSVRLAPSELNQISQAAKASNLNTSDFIRMSALAAAAGELDLNTATALLGLRNLLMHGRAVQAEAARLLGGGDPSPDEDSD